MDYSRSFDCYLSETLFSSTVTDGCEKLQEWWSDLVDTIYVLQHPRISFGLSPATDLDPNTDHASAIKTCAVTIAYLFKCCAASGFCHSPVGPLITSGDCRRAPPRALTGSGTGVLA
ncbi:hypothetical protein EVAR_7384_1 [Eumeta japonica]|uniref:Uncharacterized protein n=1 Tax=Eumeta variegata TaxID=151549 RepID=A0A4C1V6A6_EUMVA|nr:hypothetical protein EVAR_7384_1 [Eumeta japonica]